MTQYSNHPSVQIGEIALNAAGMFALSEIYAVGTEIVAKDPANLPTCQPAFMTPRSVVAFGAKPEFWVMNLAKLKRCEQIFALLILGIAGEAAAACDPIFQQSHIPAPAGFYLCSASGLYDQQYLPITTADIPKLGKNAFDYGEYHYQGEIELTGIISKFEYEAYGVITLFTVLNDDAKTVKPAETRLEEYTRQRTFEFHDLKVIGHAALTPMFNDYGWCATATVKVSKIRIDVQDTDGIFGPLLTEFNIINQGPFEKCLASPSI